MAEDPELARLRAQRMTQMGGSAQQLGGGKSAEQEEQMRRKKEAEEEQKRMILNQIMSPEAREKLANIRLVKPERADQVEMMVINAARSGQLQGRISEDQLKDLLRNVTEQTQKRTRVTIVRRKQRFDDDDDDGDDDDW